MRTNSIDENEAVKLLLKKTKTKNSKLEDVLVKIDNIRMKIIEKRH